MTLDEIITYLKPRVEVIGDCWDWKLCCEAGVTPVMKPPRTRKMAPVRRVILIAKGVKVKGKDATCSCGNAKCVNPDHAVAWSRSKTMKRTTERTKFTQSVTRNAAISRSKRSKSKLTIETVREIRLDPCTQREAATKYNISQHTVWSIRTHRTWKEYANNPFNGLGARS
jgi:predicted DNA-binding protein (UPF0251 family)